MAFYARTAARSDCERQTPTAKTLADQPPSLPAELRAFLAGRLRTLYASGRQNAPSPRIMDLIAQLEAVLERRGSEDVDTFREALLALLPDLRGYALSVAKNSSNADDLVQETLLKAWQKQHLYRPGSNLKAWTFTILRNHFYTEYRRSRREVEDVDGAAAGQLTTICDQVDRVALKELLSRIEQLPLPQQEALHHVAVLGMTYEEAAEVLQCQIGTVKSRVSRARDTLINAVTRRRPQLHLA